VVAVRGTRRLLVLRQRRRRRHDVVIQCLTSRKKLTEWLKSVHVWRHARIKWVIKVCSCLTSQEDTEWLKSVHVWQHKKILSDQSLFMSDVTRRYWVIKVCSCLTSQEYTEWLKSVHSKASKVQPGFDIEVWRHNCVYKNSEFRSIFTEYQTKIVFVLWLYHWLFIMLP
jgi:hypothetical protein